jgi:hypothetical protein
MLPVIDAFEQSKDSSRNADEKVIVVRATGLKDQHTLCAISCQALSQNTSSSASSADDVVVWLGSNLCLSR